MANPYVFECSSLTGGVDGALDSLNTTSLPDATHAKVDDGSTVTTHVFNVSSSLTADGLNVIDPVTGPGQWLLSFNSESANQADVDALANGPGYWFDGVDDSVRATIQALGLSDMSFVVQFNTGDDTGDGHLLALENGLSADEFDLSITSGNLRARIASESVTGGSVSDGKNHIVSFSGDRDGNGLMYNNGVLFASSDISGSVANDISDTNFYVGNRSTADPFNGSIFSSKLFNLALDNTDPTDKAIINGGALPYKYIGASQTEQTSGTLEIGKSYRINNWITADDFTNVGGANVDGTEFVATATTPTTWTNSSTVVRIGCVLDLNNTGITDSQWLDNSGNELHGTVSGALPTNLPSNDVQRYRHTVAITDDTTWTDIVPAGYMLESITFVESAGNAATLDLGTTSGASDVFSQEVIAASTITVVTINQAFSMTAKQSLYLNDDGAGTWNSASITATLTLRRLI